MPADVNKGGREKDCTLHTRVCVMDVSKCVMDVRKCVMDVRKCFHVVCLQHNRYQKKEREHKGCVCVMKANCCRFTSSV